MKKLVKITLIVVGILVLVWMGASWLDVICHNLDPNPTYAIWNVFAMLF